MDNAKEPPIFSVIIPTHNGADRIRKALDSVRIQAFTDYELIVVCDACEDNTEEIAREYEAQVLKVDFHRDGLSRNAGLDVAGGKWILFLDDDDWYLHEFVFGMLYEILELNDDKRDVDILNFSYIIKGKGYTEQRANSIHTPAWCRCCKREFIGDIRFGGEEYGSDNGFFRVIMQKKPVIAFWNTPMYYYNYMRKGSMTERMMRNE